MKKRQSPQYVMLGKLDSYMCNNEIRNSVTPYTKINPKQIKDLNVRPDTIELLEDKVGRTLFDLNHCSIFFDLSPRVMAMNKWDPRSAPAATATMDHAEARQLRGTTQKRGYEELPLAHSQGRDRECENVTVQERPRGGTPHPRSSGCTGAGGPRGVTPSSRSGGATMRRYSSSKVRSSGCASSSPVFLMMYSAYKLNKQGDNIQP